MRIVFMGTPEFAVPSLEILLKNHYNVVAVVTAEDKPAGRGQKLQISEVKACALRHNLPILQPTKLKAPEFVETLRSYQADLQVVVAFRMLPEVVWAMPPLGTFNLHASLLPKYRGAAPINWAIINGETETGVTTFFIQHEIDTGNIIFQEKEPIFPQDNAGTLHERLKIKGAELVLKTVQAIESHAVQAIPQAQLAQPSYAPKIFRETCQINFNQTAQQIHNFVRGLAPYPAAWTILKGKTCKIYQTEVWQELPPNFATTDWQIGQPISDNKHWLCFKTAEYYISIKELQLESKKRMSIEEFLRGNKL
ncbi:MAG: methionyl-tRNA formyltransferase [Microscillaceae bacterium]|nr:methionyl-tRNA formyltransferase [Microscillaceae bacterium]MDW8460914.1 methionyl-tRNA formyltransferase [Cytophagales bacterium]